MGGDGATTGNYARLPHEPGTASLDAGIARYADTGNALSFVAASFTTPPFWDDAALSMTNRGFRQAPS